MKTPRAQLAGRLLLLLWAATAGTGCLWPQDVDLPPIPPQRNSPLRLLKNTATPPQVLSELKLGSGCVMPEFKINVEDPDTGDPITSQWYVDPGLLYPVSSMQFGRRIATSQSEKTIRDEPVQPISLPELKVLLLQKLNKPVQVEVVATDGIFSGDGLTLVVPDRDELGNQDQYYLDSYTWFVTPTDTACASP
ncbi:MAG: hypothetical protein K1X64_10370 [Myxococcaceae bacterium]|nr:hypothetical protein [Myxococcaceae bacterium]